MTSPLFITILCAVCLCVITAGNTGNFKGQVTKKPSSITSQPHKIIVSDLNNTKYNPQAAYNSKHDEYLVVWERTDGNNPGIYGQRLNIRGEKTGTSPFSIAVGTKSRHFPAVDYDPLNDRYLVVWSHDHDGSGNNWDISGRFIPWQGSSDTHLEFKIGDLPFIQSMPKVVYNGTKKEFLILWLDGSALSLKTIMGSRLYADGSGFVLKNMAILETVSNLQPFYDLAFNHTRNEYLITWTKISTGTNSDLYMTRLRGDGQILGSKEDVITNSKDNDTEPTVAAWLTKDGYDGYLVVWRTVDSAGNDKLIGLNYAGNLNSYYGIVLIQETKKQEILPEAVTNHQGDQALVVWLQESSKTPGSFGVLGRFTKLEEQNNPVFEISPPEVKTSSMEPPAAAGGKLNFLTAWAHERPSSNWREIHARLISKYSSYLPITMRQ